VWGEDTAVTSLSSSVVFNIYISITVNTPDIVENVKAVSISPTEINVTWSQARSSDDFPITAYTIDFQIVHG